MLLNYEQPVSNLQVIPTKNSQRRSSLNKLWRDKQEQLTTEPKGQTRRLTIGVA